jgi:hypothetical protein
MILKEPLFRPSVARTFTPVTAMSMKSPFGTLTCDKTEVWNGKSNFPNLSLEAFPKPEPSQSKEVNPFRLPSRSIFSPPPDRSLDPFDAYPPVPRATRKWTDDDFERYFTHLRISPSRDATVKEERRQPGLLRPRPLRATSDDAKTSESDESVSDESTAASSGRRVPAVSGTVGVVPERNRVDLERIRKYLDLRTTIMVKNVPNKYTQVFLSPLVNAHEANAYGVR